MKLNLIKREATLIRMSIDHLWFVKDEKLHDSNHLAGMVFFVYALMNRTRN